MKWLVCMMMTLMLLVGCKTSAIREYDMYAMTRKTCATTFKASNGVEIPYRVAAPSTYVKIPLIVFLHGAGGNGSDNMNQLRDGVGCILKYMEEEEEEAVLVIPQCPTNHMWSDDQILQALRELVLYYTQSEQIDKDRVYLTGFSMGGAGTWSLGMKYPELFTAMAPVAGGPMMHWKWDDPVVPDTMLGMNVWSVIYFDDPVVNPNYSKKIIAQLWTKNSMSAHLLEELSGGHTSEIYSRREFLDRIFGSRKLSALFQ